MMQQCSTAKYLMSPKESNSSSNIGISGKRLDFITWHEHHMLIAEMSADLCKNPANKSACLVVDSEDYVIASGHEREFLNHSSHSIFLALSTKTTKSAENCSIYITELPECEKCIDLIIMEKIGKIFYLKSKSLDIIETLKSANIKCEKYLKKRKITIET